MSFESNAKSLARQPFAIYELHLDKCSNTFGNAPCTASGTQCYNTKATCKDPANYAHDDEGLVVKLCTASNSYATGLHLIPCVVDYSELTTTLTAGKGLGTRGAVTLDIQDLAYDYLTIDPYIQQRTQASTGTFWGKLLARIGDFWSGRRLVIKQGFLVDGVFNESDAKTFEYLIEKITRSTVDRQLTLTAVDLLKKIDKNRAKIPAQSNGELDSSVTDVATTFTVGSGQGAQYTDQHIMIGKEICEVTNVAGDVLTVVRGKFNTLALAYDANEKIQNCATLQGNIVQVIKTILTTYAGIDSSYIVDADWQSEQDTWLAGFNVFTVITKPEDANKLVNELLELGVIDLWFDSETQKIKLRAISPFNAENIVITDDHHIGDISLSDATESRLSRIMGLYGVKDYTQKMDEISNYRRVYTITDSDAEGAEEYGDIRAKIFPTRWLDATSASRDIMFSYCNRTINRYRQNPLIASMTLDIGGGGLSAVPKVGEVILLRSQFYQLPNGQTRGRALQVINSAIDYPNGRVKIKCVGYEAIDTTPDSGDAITYYINSSQLNYNLWHAIGRPPTAVTINVVLNDYIGSGFSTEPAFKIGNFASGSVINLTINNTGGIMGKGGDGGGAGGIRTTWDDETESVKYFHAQPNAGEDGSDALELTSGVTVNLTLNSGGFIGAGSGGDAGKMNEYAIIPTTTDEGYFYTDANGGNGGQGYLAGVGGIPYGAGVAGSTGNYVNDLSAFALDGSDTTWLWNQTTYTKTGGTAGRAIVINGATLTITDNNNTTTGTSMRDTLVIGGYNVTNVIGAIV